VAVASAHPLSTAAGLEVLRAGGNAFDAALAVSAALPVVQPHMNGLGSDFFALIRGRSTVAVSASGPAGRNASPGTFQGLGLRRVPARGPLSSITVPGLVAAWSILGRGAHLRRTQDFAPAIRIAQQGFLPSPSLARAARVVPWADSDFRRLYGAVRTGTRFRQPSLARTLARIAGDDGHGFYHGRLARQICRDLAAKGGMLDPVDLDEFSPQIERPLRLRYRRYTVETNPPPSQGATALLWLNLLARQELAGIGPRRFVQALERTMRVAYAYRATVIGDPRWVRFPRYLLRRDADYSGAPDVGGPERTSGSDTTAFSVYDGEVGISAIQSNYGGFGSGVAIRGTGITLNNRGSYFTLDPSHPNVLAPGKRTFHTLMSTIVSGPRTVLLGSMGGDVQPQVNVQVLTRHLDLGWSLPEAIAAPRFAYPASIYASAAIYREPGLLLPSAKLLRRRPALFGHAQGISIGEKIETGVDPRGDGLLPLPS
jgi:gamma-glutamyltranspeptidase/glutathione hydrolase